MKRLNEILNIGEIMEKRLSSVGIHDAETLMKTDGREESAKSRLKEGDTCSGSVCGLEGAIQGNRWHYLPDESNKDLKNSSLILFKLR